MSNVAILTPDPSDTTYNTLWRNVLARLQTTLEGSGITVTPTPWVDHVDDADALRDYDRVLPLLAWGYHRDHARWMRACATWDAAGIRLSNPARVLAANSDKRYLATLAEAGVAIPPTTWAEQPTQAHVEAMFDATGAQAIIVKPTVSGGAWETQRLERGDAIGETPAGMMLLQPYLPTIESEGETSLLFFGGRLSHAVNKRPPAGEFRVQEQFGGLYTALAEPPAAALALAQQVLDAIGEPLLYARIDMVPDAEGRWLLMEAELIEPDFYLGVDPARGAAFAQALRDVV